MSCVSKEKCLQILTDEISDHVPKEKQEDYNKAVERVTYEFEKTNQLKPRFHKGKSIKDWYTCSHCGKTVSIMDNFCSGCGFGIKWDSTRCLTK